ncbi:MAG: YjiH family protein [Pseudomonadota bacterium]
MSDDAVSTEGVRWSVVAKCVLVSAIGIGLFLYPMDYNGSRTIGLGILTNELSGLIGDQMRYFTVPIFVAGALVAFVYNLLPTSVVSKLPWRERFVSEHWVWTLLALMAGVVSSMTLLQLGPEWVVGKGTGVTAYVDVAGAIFLIIGLGCLFLPFLTDYGLLELVGTLLQRPFQFVFRLPGRATIDTLASWVGASSVAVIMTSRQYQRGFYTARESAVIATNFSVVSLPFVYFVSQIAGVSDQFFQLYGSMILVCLVCALVTPLLPPLSRVPDRYHEDRESQLHETVPEDRSRMNWAVTRALEVGGRAPSPILSLRSGFASMVEIFLTMMPVGMSIQFLALVFYEYTPVFQWITYPIVPVLQLLQIPEAVAVAPGVVIGLLDQFVPAVIAGTIDAPLSQFVLAGLSVTQLIFFAESAVLITRSPIPLSVPQLVLIFVIRTIIAVPILAFIGHQLY